MPIQVLSQKEQMDVLTIFVAKNYLPNHIVQEVKPENLGKLTSALQTFLKKEGYTVRVDGVFGPDTHTWAKEYLRSNGVPESTIPSLAENIRKAHNSVPTLIKDAKKTSALIQMNVQVVFQSGNETYTIALFGSASDSVGKLNVGIPALLEAIDKKTLTVESATNSKGRSVDYDRTRDLLSNLLYAEQNNPTGRLVSINATKQE